MREEVLIGQMDPQIIHQADYVVPVEIDNQVHNVYVIKRPGVDAFLQRMGQIFEVVVFTASLSKVRPFVAGLGGGVKRLG
jgi:hypothetical protein